MKWRGIVLNAVFASLVLLEGVITVATHTDDKPAWPKHWDTRVLPIVAFVESERGLTFKHPAPVRFLSDAAFQTEVSPQRTDTAKDKAELEQAVRMLRALGLVAGKVDLRKAESDLLQSDIVGLYVPSKKTVFVRGSSLTPATRVVLAHELTHVLQDQYFDLTRIRKQAFGGDDTSVTALIEGDAVRIQNKYVASLSASDQADYRRESLAGVKDAQAASDAVPQVLTDILDFPYAFGPVFLAQLEQDGGNTGVDKAFRHPPSEEAQIFDPLHHPYTENAKKLPAPVLPPSAKGIGKPGPFGQVTLFEVLSTKLTYQQAFSAVQGWSADTSQNYTLRGRTCVAIDVQAPGVLPGARAWATTTNASVTQNGPTVSIRSCDPGDAARALPVKHPSAFEVLEGRAAIITAFTSQGAPIAKATCIADGLVSRLGPSRYGLLLKSDLSPAETAAIHGIIEAAAGACL